MKHTIEDLFKKVKTNDMPELAYDTGRISDLESFISSNGSFEVQNWLPFIAKEYKISENLADYFVVPVIIMPTDLPNRKQVAFPLKSLTAFNPTRGTPCYKTWRGMPVQIDHQNTDITKAIGVVLDTALRPMTSSVDHFYKIMALLAIDKNKNPEVANQIKTGKRKYYSMGALIDTYECSICGMLSKRGRIDTECGHVSRQAPKFFNKPNGTVKVGHYLAHGIHGFEISTVTFPAWASAETDLNDLTDLGG